MDLVTILVLLVLNIALPTLDTVTDINLVIKLFRAKHHYYMATAMLIPFLLNYFVCFITFFRKEKNKKFTFISPLLNLYLQFSMNYELSLSREIIGIIIFIISEAARIIYLLVKNPSEGRKEKKIFYQEIGLLETCLESVPTAMIMSVIWASASESRNNKLGTNLILLFTDHGNGSLGDILFHGDTYSSLLGLPPSRVAGEIEFFITYITSVISAALGLTFCLKNGVARPIAPGGPLDGLLTGKFLLGFLASGWVLASRGFCLAYKDNCFITLTILLLFFPPFFFSLFATLNLKDASSLKILYRHPSLIILPTFTYFTFCNTNSKVIFSKKFTWINMAVNAGIFGVWAVAVWGSIVGWDRLQTWGMGFSFFSLEILSKNYFLSVILPLHLLSIIFTALFLHLDKLCCCNPREELSVYDPALDVVVNTEENVEAAVPDTDGDKTDNGEQIEMAKLVPDLLEEERVDMEGGEVAEAPDNLETISHSENETENIVKDLTNDVITEIIM